MTAANGLGPAVQRGVQEAAGRGGATPNIEGLGSDREGGRACTKAVRSGRGERRVDLGDQGPGQCGMLWEGAHLGLFRLQMTERKS